MNATQVLVEKVKVDNAKRLLYFALLRMPHELLSDVEVNMMCALAKEEAIQRVLSNEVSADRGRDGR